MPLPNKCIAEIHDFDENIQKVTIEYEHYSIHKFFGDESYHHVNYIKVLDDLTLVPSDISQDLLTAIAEDLGEDELNIILDPLCTMEYTVLRTPENIKLLPV